MPQEVLPGVGREEIPAELSFGGTVDRVIFHNADNGFSVLSVSPDASDAGRRGIPRQKFTCVGLCPNVQGGMKLKFFGQWTENSKYGRQFRFSRTEEDIPTSENSLISYLSSGLIKGVGPDLAARIVAAFGQDTVNILDNEPEKLRKVKGVGPKKYEGIVESWKEHRSLSDLMQLLQPLGISPAYGIRIFRAYGSDSVAVVRENPYRLAMDIKGIGFLTADRLAERLGTIAKDSELRMQAGVLYTLQMASENGDVFLPGSVLRKRAAEQLGADEDAVAGAIDSLVLDNRVVVEEMFGEDGEKSGDSAVYLSSFHTYESKTAFYLERIKQVPATVCFKNIEGQIAEALKELPYRLSDEQVAAVHMAAESKIMVLTGGPGTGKTTIIRAILSLYRQVTQRILLAAPTGRAAKRMSESTGMEAKTLHRLLEFNPVEGEFCRNEDQPLGCDLLIVDEASMMDVMIFYFLLKAVPSGCVVIFVGDIFQLPSVGPGSVLSDIIESGTVPVAQLSFIFRQGHGSDISENAHLINNGQVPCLANPVDRKTDFYFMGADDPDTAADLIVQLVSRRLPEHYGLNPFTDIQVLTPMHKGSTGSDSLNEMLQAALNPNGLEIRKGERRFRLGDKVMQIRNNYDKDVFNGDIGRIDSLNPSEKTLQVKYDDMTVSYDFSDLEELVPAYAISIHKSQGSEYPCVVLPLLTSHYIMLKRNLLYTAITRGRKLVVIVGQRKAVEIAVKVTETHNRYTQLAWRLREYRD